MIFLNSRATATIKIFRKQYSCQNLQNNKNDTLIRYRDQIISAIFSFNVLNMATIEKDTVLKSLNEIGILPLFYHSDPSLAIEVVKACYDAGARNFEFVDRGDHTLTVLKALFERAKDYMPDMAIGVGTVYTPEKPGYI